MSDTSDDLPPWLKEDPPRLVPTHAEHRAWEREHHRNSFRRIFGDNYYRPQEHSPEPPGPKPPGMGSDTGGGEGSEGGGGVMTTPVY